MIVQIVVGLVGVLALALLISFLLVIGGAPDVRDWYWKGKRPW